MSSFVTSEYKQKVYTFLFTLFNTRSGIKHEILTKYINEETINTFITALTHPSFDTLNNYEYYEILGDATLNKCTVYYFHSRFPQLKTMSDGNHRMSLLKTNNVSKNMFATLSTKLGMHFLIRYKENYIVKDKERHVLLDNKLKTDIFEALMGAIEVVVNDMEGIMGLGEAIVYNIFSSLMDQEHFSIDLEDIMDPKTHIIQLFSKRKTDKIDFRTEKNIVPIQLPGGKQRIENFFSCTITIDMVNPVDPDNMVHLTFSSKDAKTKLVAEKNASKSALEYLKNNYNIQ